MANQDNPPLPQEVLHQTGDKLMTCAFGKVTVEDYFISPRTGRVIYAVADRAGSIYLGDENDLLP